jgi:hypothetical protein
MSRSLLSQFPTRRRSHAAAESPPHANSALLRDLRKSVLILIVKAESGATGIRLWWIKVVAGFRRLSAEAQQSTLSKLYNRLKLLLFLVLSYNRRQFVSLLRG